MSNVKRTYTHAHHMHIHTYSLALPVPISVSIPCSNCLLACLLSINLCSALGLVHDGATIRTVFGFDGTRWEAQHTKSIWLSQNLTALAITVFLVPLSFALMQRKEPLISRYMINKVFWNPQWIVAALLVLCMQLAFFFIATNSDTGHLVTTTWPVILGIIGWPFVILAIDLWIKAKYRKWYDRNQRFLRLEYDTKLGMYSPVSPFEDRWAR
jgi:hypothetical protein